MIPPGAEPQRLIPALPSAVDRRALVALAARLGVGAFVASALLPLSACGASTRAKREAQIGSPIPPDPLLKRPGATARASTAPGRSQAPVVTGGTPAGVIERAHWTRERPIMALANPMGQVRRITVHHDGIGSQPTGEWSDSVRRLTSIRNGHLNNGWADIGYHFAIDPKGRVWAGRPLNLQGAHVKDQNENNLGIVVLGNFDRAQPTDAARRALAGLIGSQMRGYRIGVRNVSTHRELAPTACPGVNLQKFMVFSRSPSGSIGSVRA
jgi:hypothetical protein